MLLYHFTCEHSVPGIRESMRLRGTVHPLLPDAGPLVHLTDLAEPDRLALGLTSYSLGCDRTQYRVVVVADRADAAEHWPVFCRRIGMPRSVRERFEGAPGARPAHWWVSSGPVDVLGVARVA